MAELARQALANTLAHRVADDPSRWATCRIAGREPAGCGAAFGAAHDARPGRIAKPDEFPELDECYVRLLDRRAAPGETRDETITRLLIDVLGDGPGVVAREQVRGGAEEYAAALADSVDPAAAAWAEALDWFAERTKGGGLSMLVLQEFVERFGVGRARRRATKTSPSARRRASGSSPGRWEACLGCCTCR